MRGDEQVLDDLGLARLHHRVVNFYGLQIALGGERDGDHAAAGGALHGDAVELGLERLHLRLKLRRLLHHAHEVHQSSLSSGPASAAGSSGATCDTPTTLAPGKRFSTARTSGSSCTPRSSSAFCASA